MSSDSGSSFVSKVSDSLKMIVGMGSPIAFKVLLHSVDTVRTRMQTQPKSVYPGVRATTATILGEGWKSFFRGAAAVGVLTVPVAICTGVANTLATTFVSMRTTEGNNLGFLESMSPILFSAAFYPIFGTPMEVIRQRLQVGPHLKGYDNSWQATKRIYAEEGLRGFYRGTLPSAFSYGLYNFTSLTVYGTILGILSAASGVPESQADGISKVVFTAVAAGIGTLAACPLEVIRTNMQVYSPKEGGWKSSYETYRGLVRYAGFRSLWRGGFAYFAWQFPVTLYQTLNYW